MTDPRDEFDSDIIPIEPEAVTSQKRCAVCFASMAPDSRVCSQCAYDERKGLTSSRLYERLSDDRRSHHPPKTCAKCGYDLRGVNTTICPECGTDAARRPAPTAREFQDAENKWKSFTLPALIFAIGIVGVLGFYAVADHTLIPLYLVRFAARAPLLFAVYLMCALIWVGFDEPFHVTAFRFFCIVPMLDLVGILSYAFFSWFLVPGLVNMIMVHRWCQIVALFVLLKEVVEVEIEDAAILSLLLMVVYFASNLFILRTDGLM
jgi:hypothetical protein